MTTRLLLVRHAATPDTRAARFPRTTGAAAVEDCAPLDRAGHVAAAQLRGVASHPDRVWCSFAVRAGQTAQAAGWTVDEQLAELAEGDFGPWAGLALDEVHDTDAEGLTAWFDDPDLVAAGAEPFAAVRVRAAAVLGRAAAAGGTTVAVTHGGLVKAAVLEVLELPGPTVWRLDVAPASITELHHVHGRWRLSRLNWTSVVDEHSSSPKGGSAPDEPSSSPKGGSAPDEHSSSPKGGSAPDEHSSSPKGGSAPDEHSSSPKGGSAPR